MEFPWLGVFFWVGVFTWLSIIRWTRFLRERERQVTLRAFAQSDRPLDAEALAKMFPESGWSRALKPRVPTAEGTSRALMIGGIVVLFAGIGLLVGAQVARGVDAHALWGMSTGGVIVGCIALGMITASIVVRRMALRDTQSWHKDDGGQ
jgi:hypothetical protein